jgi:hypothetical protein
LISANSIMWLQLPASAMISAVMPAAVIFPTVMPPPMIVSTTIVVVPSWIVIDWREWVVVNRRGRVINRWRGRIRIIIGRRSVCSSQRRSNQTTDCRAQPNVTVACRSDDSSGCCAGNPITGGIGCHVSLILLIHPRAPNPTQNYNQ